MARSSSAQRFRQSLITAVRLVQRYPVTSILLPVALTAASLGLAFTKSGIGDPKFSGLLKLATTLQLLQAFKGDPSLAPPQLWNARLGLNPARTLWSRLGTGIWWQGWSADGQSYLVLPGGLLNQADLRGVLARRLEGVVVVSADALNQVQLDQRLRDQSLSRRFSPLQQDCLHRLAKSPSVQWKPEGLARLSGTLSPLMQQSRYGCLSLWMNRERLHWQGVVGGRDFASAPANWTVPAVSKVNSGVNGALPSSDAVLKVQGQQLGVLLGALADREIVRLPLEQHYGLGRRQRQELLTSPFQMQLLKQPKGRFQAGLQLQLQLGKGSNQKRFERALQTIQGRLQDQGLRSKGTNPLLWTDPNAEADGLLGGWQWLTSKGEPRSLSIGLGIAPATSLPAPIQQEIGARAASEPWLVVEANPQQLHRQNLLAGSWPRVIQSSPSLELTLERLESGRSTTSDWLLLRGSLVVPRKAHS